MFAPKKTIPKLVVGMLALTGCAAATDSMPGGSGGDGGSGGASGTGGTAGMGGIGGIGGMTDDDLTIAARAWCMELIECWYPQYDPEDCDGFRGDVYRDESAECQAAAISYFECFVEREDCDDFESCVVGDACD